MMFAVATVLKGVVMARKKQSFTITGRDEMNLAAFPFAKLGSRDKRTVIEYEGWTTDLNGRRLKQKWTVEGSPLRGLPDEFDERVLVALLSITAKRNFEERILEVSIYEILGVMRLNQHTKQNYVYVTDALRKLTSITIFTESSFFDNRQKRWVSHEKGFNVLDSYEVSKSEQLENGNVIFQSGHVIWGEQVWESIRSGYHKALDLDTYYKRLNSATARKLYRLFDKALTDSEEYRVDVLELAQRIGMSPNYEFPSKVVHKLKSALEELVQNECISSWKTASQQRVTELIIRRERAQPYQLNMLLPAPDAPFQEDDDPSIGVSVFDVPTIVKELCYYGFPRQEATELTSAYGEAHVQECVRMMEQTYRVGKPPKSPSDWLRNAITQA
jgi:hypothetical protein